MRSIIKKTSRIRLLSKLMHYVVRIPFLSTVLLKAVKRMTEKKSILERLNKIDNRCKEIDNEKARLLKIIGENNDNVSIDSSPALKTVIPKEDMITNPITPEEVPVEQNDYKMEQEIEKQIQSNCQNNNEGFKIRY